ncbi:IMMP2L [Symbiodinium sp. CCMP2592]|nr:IMMP2L [Symbiodinium sp. CCMP2592]
MPCFEFTARRPWAERAASPSDWLKTCVAALRLPWTLECFHLQGRSMMPTLRGGPGLCDSDLVVGLRPGRSVQLVPQTGDIVLLVDESGRMVKRLKNIVFEAPTVFAKRHDDWALQPLSSLRGWCWVEGDNAMLSEDSRIFGWLPSHRLEAVAIAVVWPPWRSTWLLEPRRVRDALSPEGVRSLCCCRMPVQLLRRLWRKTGSGAHGFGVVSLLHLDLETM